MLVDASCSMMSAANQKSNNIFKLISESLSILPQVELLLQQEVIIVKNTNIYSSYNKVSSSNSKSNKMNSNELTQRLSIINIAHDFALVMLRYISKLVPPKMNQKSSNKSNISQKIDTISTNNNDNNREDSISVEIIKNNVILRSVMIISQCWIATECNLCITQFDYLVKGIQSGVNYIHQISKIPCFKNHSMVKNNEISTKSNADIMIRKLIIIVKQLISIYYTEDNHAASIISDNSTKNNKKWNIPNSEFIDKVLQMCDTIPI